MADGEVGHLGQHVHIPVEVDGKVERAPAPTLRLSTVALTVQDLLRHNKTVTHNIVRVSVLFYFYFLFSNSDIHFECIIKCHLKIRPYFHLQLTVDFPLGRPGELVL